MSSNSLTTFRNIDEDERYDERRRAKAARIGNTSANDNTSSSNSHPVNQKRKRLKNSQPSSSGLLKLWSKSSSTQKSSVSSNQAKDTQGNTKLEILFVTYLHCYLLKAI
jgi:hypothetical protein